MRVVFRVDSSFQIGTGHVMRCLCLAYQLQKRGSEVWFICRNHAGNMIDKIRAMGFLVVELSGEDSSQTSGSLFHSDWLGVSQEEDLIESMKVLSGHNVDWLVVDHYAIDRQWESALNASCRNLMIIDDLADRQHDCRLLVDQTFGRERQDYFGLVDSTAATLIGSRYALLREEFEQWREISLGRRKTPSLHRIMINMGGVDSQNFTEAILDQLNEYEFFHQVEVLVIMGGRAMHLTSIMNKVKSLGENVTIQVDVKNMAEILAQTDIAIGSAGTSSWERCCLGVPTIQLVIAENQKFLAETLADNGVAVALNDINNLGDILSKADNWMQSTSINAAKLTDGQGVEKVIDVMTKISNE